MTRSDKRPSLQHCKMNYGRRMFYITGPGKGTSAVRGVKASILTAKQ